MYIQLPTDWLDSKPQMIDMYNNSSQEASIMTPNRA